MRDGTDLSRTTLVVVLAVTVVAASGFAGTALAASDASISATSISAASHEPGFTPTHSVTVTVDEATAGSWTGLAVNDTDSDA